MCEDTELGPRATVLICPDCTEEVRSIAPTSWAPSWQRPDYSHQDGTELCPDYSNDPGRNTGRRRPSRPVAFVPLAALTPA
ncbi:hypothetical protein [Nocardiopsis sp. FR6]|uniref:hypothetical protein n=1 Tax=Nocardiopsis sp. FR6 TaxID=2605986 RepID=UPI001358788D|nr:hypothetical protein [Nocardiopsis sp. FR6]